MARRTKEEAEATRESVLRAALDLFSEKGYSRTTLNDIAKRIGMTRGAVYWHFDNKEALLAAMIDYVHTYKQELVESLIPDIQTLADMREAFQVYARAMAEDAMLRKFGFFMHFQMEWSQVLLSETHRKLTDLRKSPLEELKSYFEIPQIARHLKEGADLDQLVVTLAAFWLGSYNMYLGGSPFVELSFAEDKVPDRAWQLDLVQTIGDGFDMIMNGVLKGEEDE